MAKEKLYWKSRLKGESQKLFNRFKIYRDLSPEERSLENVQKILKKDNNGQKIRITKKSHYPHYKVTPQDGPGLKEQNYMMPK